VAADGAVYPQVLGLNSRKLVWFLAQLHLFFGAFVLGVPIFAVIIEIIGWRGGDKRYDDLAHEFTSLLTVAYATTAALGGIFTFALMTLYPHVMGYMAGQFKNVLLFYAVLFLFETLLLYLYYYGWRTLRSTAPFGVTLRTGAKIVGALVIAFALVFLMGDLGAEMRTDTRVFIAVFYMLPLGAGLMMIKDVKSVHILIGILLNIAGTAIMQMANSMVGFMMSPTGVDAAGVLTGSAWTVFDNGLATPIAIHRMLGNVAFGALIAGAYGAVRFIGAKSETEKAHYDWMGYVSNFIAMIAILPLPFAGYYLGREIYSVSPVMGNDMMGGDFSWTFILQAVLVGALFIISNYYLWAGMERIPGAERYYRWIKFILFALVVSFAIWLTPHNLPLAPQEVGQMGGSQYHPTLKYLGLMPAKNAVINLIILSTFFSFLLYRRGNKKAAVSIVAQGTSAKIGIAVATVAGLALIIPYAASLLNLDLSKAGLVEENRGLISTLVISMAAQCVATLVAAILALRDRGGFAQVFLMTITALNLVAFLGVFGFVVMDQASPLLRQMAVAQFLQLMSCLVVVAVIDVFLYRGAESMGRLRWGKMTHRSQYALLLLTFVITVTMGMMGYVRSGLRGDWHIYGIMRDTSPWAHTPTDYTMSLMVSLIVAVFMLWVTVMFWLGSMARNSGKEETDG